MFLSKARFLSKFRPCFNFSTFKSGDISMDLLLTLSMQEADKKYKTNDELVQSLVNKNLLKTDILIQAMKKFDRSLFVKTVGKDIYQDRPHSIGQGEDISAPMMQAIAAEALYPVIASIAEKEPVKVIDIGTGSGYLPFMLYYALSEKFKNREDLHLTILGIDHELEFVKNTNLLFADFVEKGILEPHPSIIFKFAKREFFGYVGSPNMTGLENRVINIGAAVDLRTWETLKYAAIKKRGAILSPVVQPDGEQTLMFYKKEEGQPEESSIMKVMYAQMKKPEEIDSSSKFEKYFLKDNETDDSEGKPESKEDSADNSSESNDDIYLKELKAEVQELERHVKEWSENFKVNNKRTVSLKELKEDPGMANVLERLAKQKRRLGIMQRGIRPN